jgi:ribosome-binding protein aMBF1 (putative translation factor)
VATRKAGTRAAAPQHRTRRPPPLDDLAVRVGQRLRALRQERGLSQSQLGAPYLTRAMISAIELGKVSPALKSLAHFARKLSLPLRELIPPDE